MQFNGRTWVFNGDGNFSINAYGSNPLKILTRRSDQQAKLHLYVDEHFQLTNKFPGDDGLLNEKLKDLLLNGDGGLVLDAGANAELIEADILTDDESGGRPEPMQWMKYRGRWLDDGKWPSDDRCYGPMRSTWDQV